MIGILKFLSGVCVCVFFPVGWDHLPYNLCLLFFGVILDPDGDPNRIHHHEQTP